MALAHVQTSTPTTDDAAATTIANAYTSNPTAGNLLIVFASWYNGTDESATIADTLSNTWHEIQNTAFSPTGITIAQAWYAYNCNGGGANTVTLTLPGSRGGRRLVCQEYSGAATATDPLNTSAKGEAFSAADAVTDGCTVGPITPTVNGCLIWAAMSTTGVVSIAAGTGFTQRFYTGITGRYFHGEDQIQTTAASVSGTWTFDTDGTTNQVDAFVAAFNGPVTTTQQLAPSADSVDGAWTDQAGGTSLFAAIDETTASDTDYIRSPLSPSSSACRVKLASGADPASSTGHKINWRVGKDVTGGQTIGATVTLRQGGGDSLGAGTQIATFTRSNVDAFTTYTETLSGGEADSITNYADLYLEFSGNAT